MKLKFNLRFFIVFIILLLLEICIGIFVHDTFIRPFVGDVLSVCVIYTFIRIFYSGNVVKLAVGVLLFAFGIEFLQYLNLASYLGLKEGGVAYIMLGATFDPLDLLAYLIGIIFCLIFDKKKL